MAGLLREKLEFGNGRLKEWAKGKIQKNKTKPQSKFLWQATKTKLDFFNQKEILLESFKEDVNLMKIKKLPKGKLTGRIYLC